MPTGTLAVVLASGGNTLSKTPITKTGDHPNNYEIALPGGSAGTLSTRTDDGEGVLTVAEGHGIVATDVVDIYWDGGERYNVTVDSVTATTITFDDVPAAKGDVLPAESTAIVVTLQVDINTAIDGDAIQLFGIHCDQRCQCDMLDSGPATIKQWELTADAPETWYYGSSESNPLTGNPIVASTASNGTATAATLTIISLEDSTP